MHNCSSRGHEGHHLNHNCKLKSNINNDVLFVTCLSVVYALLKVEVKVKVKFKVALRLTVCQSVSMSWFRAHSRTCDQILLPAGRLLSEIFCLVSVGPPFWREDGSSVCSAITQWSYSRRTRNHTSLSHLRFRQPGRPGPRIYIPQGQGGTVLTPGTGFPLRRLVRITGLRWRYSNPFDAPRTSSGNFDAIKCSRQKMLCLVRDKF
jgi:hypothetical protein